MHYKDENTGWVYRVSPQPAERELYFIEYLDPANSVIFKRLPDYPGSRFRESVEEVLTARAQRNGWTKTEPREIAAEAEEDCDDLVVGFISPTGFTCSRMDMEDLVCKNTYAPTGDAAATTTESAVTLPASMEETPTTSESAVDASTLTEVTAAANCVPMENVDCVTAVSLPDGKDIDVPTGFDYSGLDAQTVADLHLAEREFAAGKRLAEMGLRRMAEGVAIAHDTLCGELSQVGTTQKHGNRGEDTFKSWCESIGVSRSAAYRMLNVVELFDKSTPRQQKVLDALAPSVLYEASRPSAEPQAVEALKKGEITTLKQYKELEAQLKETQERAEQAEREAQEAKEKAHRLETRPVMSELYDANQRIKELENRPIEVATQAPTEEQINEAAKPVIQEMTAMYKVQLEQQREQIKELEGLATGAYNTLANTCLTISENLAGVFLSDFEKLQAMAQDLSENTYISVMEPIFEACREICSALEGTDDGEG